MEMRETRRFSTIGGELVEVQVPNSVQNIEKVQFKQQILQLEKCLDRLEHLVDKKIASQEESSALKFEYSPNKYVRFVQKLQLRPLAVTVPLALTIIGIMSILESTLASTVTIRVTGCILTIPALLNTVIHTDVILREIRCLIRRNGIETLKQITLTYVTFVLNHALLCYLYEVSYPGSFHRVIYLENLNCLKNVQIFFEMLYYSQMFVATASVSDIMPRFFYGRILGIISTIYAISFQAILFNNFVE